MNAPFIQPQEGGKSASLGFKIMFIFLSLLKTLKHGYTLFGESHGFIS
jgi:hypothetical protein